MSLLCAICGEDHTAAEYESGRTVIEIPLFYEESNLLPDEPGDDWVIVNIPHDVHDLPEDWDSVSTAAPECRCFRIGNQAVIKRLEGVDESDNGEGYAACKLWTEVVNPLPEDQVEYDVNGDLDAQDYMRSYQGTLQGLQGYLPHLGAPGVMGGAPGGPLRSYHGDYMPEPYGGGGGGGGEYGAPMGVGPPGYGYMGHDGMRGGLPHMRGPPPVRAPAGSLGGDPRPNMTPIPVRFMGEEATYDPSTESITWQGEEFSCNAWCKRVAGKGGQNWKRSIRVNLDNGAKRPKLYDYLHQAGMGIE